MDWGCQLNKKEEMTTAPALISASIPLSAIMPP